MFLKDPFNDITINLGSFYLTIRLLLKVGVFSRPKNNHALQTDILEVEMGIRRFSDQTTQKV